LHGECDGVLPSKSQMTPKPMPMQRKASMSKLASSTSLTSRFMARKTSSPRQPRMRKKVEAADVDGLGSPGDWMSLYVLVPYVSATDRMPRPLRFSSTNTRGTKEADRKSSSRALRDSGGCGGKETDDVLAGVSMGSDSVAALVAISVPDAAPPGSALSLLNMK
jgi:hypothetical protein